MSNKKEVSAGILDASWRLFTVVLAVAILGGLLYFADPWGIWL